MLYRNKYAAMAQQVERRLGKAEVGGSSPLGSLTLNLVKLILGFTRFLNYVILNKS